MEPVEARAYRRLLRAYPPAFRSRFGDEMAQVFSDVLRDTPASQWPALLARAVADLARTAPIERWHELRAQPVAAGARGGGSAPVRATTPMPSRRDFLRKSLLLSAGGIAAGMAGASIAYVWPSSRNSSLGAVEIGNVAELQRAVASAGGTFPVPAARAYLVAYDPADDPDGVYADLTAGTGLMALFQRCVHLGCRVPWCTSSTRFECPCHKSRYNRWGEFQDGPAPRGLDRFALEVVDGNVKVLTGTVHTGPARTGNVLAEPASGPSCLGVA
jgi:cytochrome b6-f complex iron-sulfur subunit